MRHRWQHADELQEWRVGLDAAPGFGDLSALLDVHSVAYPARISDSGSMIGEAADFSLTRW